MENKEEIIFLTKEEKEKFFKAIDMSEEKFKVRDRALFSLAYYCALKTSEIINVKIRDFDKEKRCIVCRKEKDGEGTRFVIIDDKAFYRLCEYYDERMNDDKFMSEYLFLSKVGKSLSRMAIHKITNKYCSVAEISEEKRHFHVLRHTRAIELLKLGFSAQELKWFLGLKHIYNASMYFAFLSDESEIDNNKIYRMLEKGIIDAKEENKKQSKGKSNTREFDPSGTAEISSVKKYNDS